MYINDKYAIKIHINLENGLYVFDNEASTGKTRLFKALRDCEKSGEQIGTYTYNDKLQNRRLEDVLIPTKYKLIMLDRYDMYNGEGAELINECAKSSIVLVDCKGTFTVSSEDKWCILNMSKDTIHVSE